MKKLYFIIIVCFIVISLNAKDLEVKVTARAGVRSFSEERIKKFYNSSETIFEVEGAVKWKWFEVYGMYSPDLTLKGEIQLPRVSETKMTIKNKEVGVRLVCGQKHQFFGGVGITFFEFQSTDIVSSLNDKKNGIVLMGGYTFWIKKIGINLLVKKFVINSYEPPLREGWQVFNIDFSSVSASGGVSIRF